MKKRIFAVILACTVLTGCAGMGTGIVDAGRALESVGDALEHKPAPEQSSSLPEPVQETAAPAQEEKLTAGQAEEIALNHAGLTHSQAENLRSHYDRDDGREEYDVEFRSGNYDYDYTVDAVTGEILSHDTEYEGPPAAADQGEKITAAQAEEIALNHAGLTSGEVTGLRTRFEPEEPGDPAHYEVEFRQGDLEYDYEIHAHTGEILSWEKDK